MRSFNNPKLPTTSTMGTSNNPNKSVSFCNRELCFYTFLLVLSGIIMFLFVTMSIYVIWCVHDTIYNYKVTWEEQKVDLLSTCQALNEISCPNKIETNPSEYSQLAIEWRNTCHKKINTSNIYQLSETLEKRALEVAMERIKTSYSRNKWNDYAFQHICIHSDRLTSLFNPYCYTYWLLEDHMITFWYMLVMSCILIGSWICVCCPLYAHTTWQEKLDTLYNKHTPSNNPIQQQKSTVFDGDTYNGLFLGDYPEDNEDNIRYLGLQKRR
jgi:hypothetical protein